MDQIAGWFDSLQISPFKSEAIDISVQDKDGDTMLHNAIIQFNVKVCECLISLAFNHHFLLDLPNYIRQTAMHLAVITRQPIIVRYLIAAGASCDVRDMNGNTPLHIACRDGYNEIVEELLTSDSFTKTQNIQDLDIRNFDGYTCLHLAAQSSDLCTIQHLLNHGADINSRDGKSGRTVLHYGAETGNRILTEYLLQHKRLNINCVTYGDETALRLANGRKFHEIVDILKTHGAFWDDSIVTNSDC